MFGIIQVNEKIDDFLSNKSFVVIELICRLKPFKVFTKNNV
jgi:hypothetical protein